MTELKRVELVVLYIFQTNIDSNLIQTFIPEIPSHIPRRKLHVEKNTPKSVKLPPKSVSTERTFTSESEAEYWLMVVVPFYV